jgi:hypothetical protein
MRKLWIVRVGLMLGGALCQETTLALSRANGSQGRNVVSSGSNHAVEQLRQRARLKETWDPFVQTVSNDFPVFVIGGTTVPLADLVPMDNLFSPDAIGLVDGTEEPTETTVYRSVSYPSIYALMDDNQSLLRAFRLLPDGNILELVPIDKTSFAEIDTFRDMEPFEQEEADEVCTKYLYVEECYM